MNSCPHCRPTLTANASRRRDPTLTTTTRRQFEAEVNRRYKSLARAVRAAVVERDVFGLTANVAADLPPPRAFQFERSADKVAEFMAWLRDAARREILDLKTGVPVTSSAATAWSSVYVQSAYQRGLQTAGANLRRAGVSVSEQWIQGAFLRPQHADRAGLIYTRTFEQLQGVNDAMAQQMSRVLSQGIIDGVGAQALARNLADRVDKIGKVRARVVARTEVISAHAEATLNSYEEAGVTGVGVQAEWTTAGDLAVCPQCAAMEGRYFTVSDARGLIPLHPNCRCAWLPVVSDARGLRLD